MHGFFVPGGAFALESRVGFRRVSPLLVASSWFPQSLAIACVFPQSLAIACVLSADL